MEEFSRSPVIDEKQCPPYLEAHINEGNSENIEALPYDPRQSTPFLGFIFADTFLKYKPPPPQHFRFKEEARKASTSEFLMSVLAFLLAVGDWFSDVWMAGTHFYDGRTPVALLTMGIILFAGTISFAAYQTESSKILRGREPKKIVKWLKRVPSLQLIGASLDCILFERNGEYLRDYAIENLRTQYVILEFMLEGGPQSFLQLYFILSTFECSDGDCSRTSAIISVVFSLASLASGARQLYMQKHVSPGGKYCTMGGTGTATAPLYLVSPPLLIKLLLHIASFGKYFFRFAGHVTGTVLLLIGNINLFGLIFGFVITSWIISIPRAIYLFGNYKDIKFNADRAHLQFGFIKKTLDFLWYKTLCKKKDSILRFYIILEPLVFVCIWLLTEVKAASYTMHEIYCLLSLALLPYFSQFIFSKFMLSYVEREATCWKDMNTLIQWCTYVMGQVDEGQFEIMNRLIDKVDVNSFQGDVYEEIRKYYDNFVGTYLNTSYVDLEIIYGNRGIGLLVEITMLYLARKVTNPLYLQTDVRNRVTKEVFSYLCLKNDEKGREKLKKLGFYFKYLYDTRQQYLCLEIVKNESRKYESEIRDKKKEIKTHVHRSKSV